MGATAGSDCGVGSWNPVSSAQPKAQSKWDLLLDPKTKERRHRLGKKKNII